MSLATLAVLLASLAAAGEADFEFPPASTGSVHFNADRFDYSRASGTLELEGRVSLVDSTWTITADRVSLNLDDHRAHAWGPLRLEDGLSRLDGAEGEFEYDTREGWMKGVEASYAPWRIYGARGDLEPDRDLVFKSAFFTSCSTGTLPGRTEPPHYRFRASRLKVRPKKWMYAANVVVYAGSWPVFYTPFLWKSLRRRHILSTRFSPGYDKRNGVYLRSTTLYNPARWLQGKAFVDYYVDQGLGFGNELQFRATEDARGGLYGYRIRETPTGRERWAVAGDYFQAFGSTWSAQSRLQAQSDPEFHNHYTRANAFRVTQQLVNNGAVVRATSKTTTRLSVSRLDDGDPNLRFIKTRESLPRLDWSLAPVSAWWAPWLNNFSAFADNSFERARGYQQKAVGGAWSAARTFNVARGVSLTPRAAFSEVFEDRVTVDASVASTRTVTDAFTGRYDVGGTMRFTNPLGDTDLTHAHRRRLKPDTFATDVGAPDRGVELNLTTLGHGWRPSRSLYARLETGFDFRTFRERAPSFRERVQPFSGDLNWQPRRGPQISLREEYQLVEGHRTFLLQADWGRRDARFFRSGLANTRTHGKHYFLNQEAGWSPAGGRWQVAGALRADLRTKGGLRFDLIQLFEKEVSLTRDFHDFHTRLVLRERPGGVQEVQIRVNLRFEDEDLWRRQVYTDYTGR